MEDLKKLTDDFNSNVKQLQDEYKKGNEANQTLIKNLEDEIAKYEEKNQEFVLKQTNFEKENEEIKNKLEEIERGMVNLPATKGIEVEKVKEAFEIFARKGFQGLSDEQKSYYRTDSNVEGGFLRTPAQISSEIMKNVTEMSPVRQIARVIKVNSPEWVVNNRPTNNTISWFGEGETLSATTPTYAQTSIFLNKMGVRTIISREMMEDSAFNMTQEIISNFAEDMARGEGEAFIEGSGVKRPEGITINSTINSVTSSTASEIKYADLVDLVSSLKSVYNGTFALTRKTVGYIMKNVVDGVGRPIWNPGNIAAGIPNTILGQSYVIMPDLVDPVANAYSTSDIPVLYGDFAKAYTIIDGSDSGIKRDDYTMLSSDKVVFQMSKRLGGKIVKGEAMTKLVIQ